MRSEFYSLYVFVCCHSLPCHYQFCQQICSLTLCAHESETTEVKVVEWVVAIVCKDQSAFKTSKLLTQLCKCYIRDDLNLQQYH